MNLTSILPTSGAEKRKVDRGAGTDNRPQQSSCHESTGHITARLSSFNLSGGGTQHLAAWEGESQRNAQESPVRHFGSRNRKYGIKTAQQQGLSEPTLSIGEQGMPRTKRRASTTANNHSSSEMPQSNPEDMPRHPSKRLRHTSSSRRHTRADDGAAAAAAAAASAPHHQQHHHQHHTHHHHQQPTIQQQSFSQKRCVAWFREYTTPDEPETLGPEGMEKFCEDIGVEPENVVMLVLAYKMGARQMGFFSLNEWLKGLTGLQCDSIAKLQARMDYLRNLLNDPNTFKGIYRYAYDFARDKDQRSMDMETARVMLQLLLGKHWSLFSQFAKFLDQSKYKVINKDQWCNILEFSRTISDDLVNYDLDGAWPVMLDEFVEWLKAQQQDAGVNQMDTRTS